MFPAGQQANNCCPPENKMAALNLQVYKGFLMQVYLKTTESKRDEKTQQATGNAVEILYASF